MSYPVNPYLIPLQPGQAVSRGWTPATNGRPMGITWHWTATADLAVCRRVLGGANAERKGIASAHFAVGRTFADGVDQYVSIEDRSWHAGINQTLRWDGKASDGSTKGSRATVGVETVNLGFERSGIPAAADWLTVASCDSRRILRVQPWSDEQIEMLIGVGKNIVGHWGHIGVREHHGHQDICPGYKDDVAGFPYARVLRGIYSTDVPDVWTPLRLPLQRQNALQALGYDLGTSGARRNGVDGVWGSVCDQALKALQTDYGLVANAQWSTFVCWKIFDLLQQKKLTLDALAAEVA